MCITLIALNILYHASSVLSSSAWSSFLGFVCWIYNLMHCFLDLLRSKMASWLSREGAGVAGLVHVWNPLVNRACLKNYCATPTTHTTQAKEHLFCILDIQAQAQPIGQPHLLPEELLCHSDCSHYTSFFKHLLCILDIQVQSYVMNNRQNLNLNM